MGGPLKNQGNDSVWPEVHRRLGAFIAKRIPSDVEVDDVLQTVFLRLHEQKDRMRDPSRVIPWLFKTARNAIADHYRSPARRRTTPVGDASEVEKSSALSPPEFGESEDARAELAGCLQPMLKQLSPIYRETVTLVELEGLTQKKAAERLGTSLSNVKSRVQRGRRQLRKILDECCLIQLDRRNAAMGFEPRKGKCGSC